jgi:predicted DNA binding CopG/RHH family protein
MPRKSKTDFILPSFATEAEEAEWLSNTAGRRYIADNMERAIESGTAEVETSKVERTDPAILRELLDRVKAKKTKSISIRLSFEDIELAKRVAGKEGVGYQTFLKQMIHDQLHDIAFAMKTKGSEKEKALAH